MKWEKAKLSDLCASIADGDHQSMPICEKGIPFIVISDIRSNTVDLSNSRFVPLSYYEKLDQRRKPQRGNILYSVKGSFGIPAYVRTDSPFTFQRDIAILKCNDKINSRFLFYVLKSDDYYKIADSLAIGSAQRALTLKTLNNLMVPCPPIETQRRIASILIENNRKQIKLLEEAAQRLYKEWFVDLRFPGWETAEIVDGVPVGWRKEAIGNLLEKITRTKQVMTAEYMKKGIIPIIDQSKDFIAGYTNNIETIVDIGKPVIVFGDHTRNLKFIQFPFAKGADGTQLIVSNDDCMPQSLFYCSLINVDLSNYHYARHFKYLKAEEILVPNKEIAESFDSFAAPIFNQMQKLRDKSVFCAEARDRLLPKLMSGELEV